MQFQKLQQPRGFEYTPRFYDPEKQDDGKTRISFRRIRRSPVTPKSSPARLLLIALVLLFAIIYLSRNAKQHTNTESNKIIVEEIIVID